MALFTKHRLDSYDRSKVGQYAKEFQGKSVLITGGGYGIGRSIAEAFAEAGAASILIVGRTLERLESAAATVHEAFPSVEISYRAVDLASPSSIASLFSGLQGSFDILVNNGGLLPSPSSFIEADLQSWWEGFEVNIYGTALITQGFLRARQRSNLSHPATIITMNTIGASSIRVPNLSAYGASKAGLARFVESVAVEFPEEVARFVSIHPGFVRTAMAAKSGLEGAFPATDARLAAEFVVWSATEEARFLNGRFAWVNWDIDELVEKRELILQEDLLRTNFKGL
jgi:NAD(P)-dependent dehydrogenase (short-subunit alcohol dehydrogenase family)